MPVYVFMTPTWAGMVTGMINTHREIAYEIDKELDPEAYTPQAILGRVLADNIDRQIRSGVYVMPNPPVWKLICPANK